MAFPATGNQLLADALRSSRGLAAQTKQAATTLRVRSAVGDVARIDVIGFLRQIADAITAWNSYSTLTGLGAYAQAQIGDGNLDIVAEFGVMVANATSLRDWIFANFPKDAGSGAWLVQSFDLSGSPTNLAFTTAQLAAFRTQLSAFESTIN